MSEIVRPESSEEAVAMSLAIKAAEANLHLTSPNPCVGAVLVSRGGQVLGIGATERAGGAHAEIVALRAAEAAGHSAKGASLYVTLEPCAHQGRTGPCADALIRAGVSKVVASLKDPFPLVAGRGFAKLREAGIEVKVGAGADTAREQLIGFLSRVIRGRPWVRLKVATSLDGYTALPSGESQWITSVQARADGHAWRARACAVLTGVGTVLADDPSLTVRDFDTPRQPIRIVVDSGLDTPVSARLFRAGAPGGPVWIYGTSAADPAKANALRACGASVTLLDSAAEHAKKLDLHAVLRDLAAREINELHVEAGFKLNGSMLAAGLVDELLMYQAPTLLGQGSGIARLPAVDSLANKPQLKLIEARTIGPDLRSIWRITDPQSFFPI